MMGKYKVNNKPNYERESETFLEHKYMKDEYMQSNDALNFKNVVDVPLGSMRQLKPAPKFDLLAYTN